jgi:cation:H+ antiporter
MTFLLLLGAELFTKAIEWFGHQLGLAEGAVGSVLAAVGTALPETMIPLVAIVFGAGSRSDAVGVGAILGAPFMLAILVMFVTGLAVVARARRRASDDLLAVDPVILGHDTRVFALAYGFAIAVGFLPAGLTVPRWLAAVALIATYGWYVRGHLQAEAGEMQANLVALRFGRLDRGGSPAQAAPRVRIVVVQPLAALGAIISGAVVFVGAVETLARAVGVDETLLALVIAPIATELLEKLNSLIWISRDKDTLALGNITGAMVRQAAIPTSIARLFASGKWSIGTGSWIALASAGVALASTTLIFIPMIRTVRLHGQRLLVGGILYAAQLGLVAASLSGTIAA